MGNTMKTTVDIADPVLKEARKLAVREGTTLRALVEQGLRQLISDKKQRKKKPVRLRLVTFGGQGLQPEFQDADWEKIRDVIYEGRGG